MSRSGVAHPDTIDLITRKGDEFFLCVAEDRALGDADAIPLQEKLNTYLSFALDGGLVERYPEARGRAVTIRVELHGGATPFVGEFLRRYAELLVEHGIQLAVEVAGTPLA